MDQQDYQSRRETVFLRLSKIPPSRHFIICYSRSSTASLTKNSPYDPFCFWKSYFKRAHFDGLRGLYKLASEWMEIDEIWAKLTTVKICFLSSQNWNLDYKTTNAENTLVDLQFSTTKFLLLSNSRLWRYQNLKWSFWNTLSNLCHEDLDKNEIRSNWSWIITTDSNFKWAPSVSATLFLLLPARAKKRLKSVASST